MKKLDTEFQDPSLSGLHAQVAIKSISLPEAAPLILGCIRHPFLTEECHPEITSENYHLEQGGSAEQVIKAMTIHDVESGYTLRCASGLFCDSLGLGK